MTYCNTSGPLIRVANIESDVADHCNLACAGCNHWAPHYRLGFYNLHDFRRDIEALKGLLHVRSWYLLGGEPLLNPRLTDYARVLKEAGICDHVDVWTNGLLLPTWTDPELFPLLGTLFISRYPGINYEKLDSWLNCRTLPCTVRQVTYGSFIHSAAPAEQSIDQAQATFNTCKPRNSCHQVYRGRYYLCPQSARLPKVLRREDIQEGCPIHDDDLPGRLRSLLTRTAHLESCRFCVAYHGMTRPHTQGPVPESAKVGWP
jgi:hypothetical protein